MMQDISTLKFLGECYLDVRWSDLDNYGHVNNSIYFQYMTEGRAVVLGHITPYDAVEYVLVQVACEFKKPVLYPARLLLRHYTESIGHTSFTLITQMHGDDGNVYAQGRATLVCLDPQTKKPVRIPEILKEKL